MPGKKINIITGANGAGKTSILESIYLLARARSFRQSHSRNLITENESELIVYTEIERDDRSYSRIGLSKKNSETVVRKDGIKIERLSDLATTLPLTIITPNIQRIIEEGPDHRRKLLNWGLFHVEQSYGKLLQRYNKTIDQRNIALNRNSNDLDVWTKSLAEIGEKVHKIQEDYINRWNVSLNEISRMQNDTYEYGLELQRGWKKGLTLLEAFELQKATDLHRGFTSSGPHRFEVKISVDGRNIKNYFSRGQNKILAVNLLLSQAKLLQTERRITPIILLDDFQSEIDLQHQAQVFSLLINLDLQTFITSLTTDISKGLQTEQFEMFHVEHGEVMKC